MIKDNTGTNAYDSFGQDLYIDDTVLCALITCGRIMLFKGTVIGWTKKKVKVRLTEPHNNTDWSGSDGWTTGRVGEELDFKPDKIYKIS